MCLRVPDRWLVETIDQSSGTAHRGFQHSLLCYACLVESRWTISLLGWRADMLALSTTMKTSLSLRLGNCCPHSFSFGRQRARSSRGGGGGGIRARWSFRSKFGEQSQASALMQEWVNEFAIPGGADNVEVLAGSIGNDTIEANLTFASLSELETFFASISPDQLRYRSWVDRSRGAILDGSAKWELFRIVLETTSGENGNQSETKTPTPTPTPTASLLSSPSTLIIESPETSAQILDTEKDSRIDVQKPMSASDLLKLLEEGKTWSDDDDNYDETGRIRPPPANPGDKMPGAY